MWSKYHGKTGSTDQKLDQKWINRSKAGCKFRCNGKSILNASKSILSGCKYYARPRSRDQARSKTKSIYENWMQFWCNQQIKSWIKNGSTDQKLDANLNTMVNQSYMHLISSKVDPNNMPNLDHQIKQDQKQINRW